MISLALEVHNDATADLRAIGAVDPAGAAQLVALLLELRTNPTLHTSLLTKDVGSPPARPLSAKRWGSVNTVERLPIWRLRAWELERNGLHYRLFYVFDYKRQMFAVIAITRRDLFDYDDTQHPLRIRMVRCIRTDYRSI